MKKLLLAAVFTLAAFAATAQTVTQESLQGKWEMVYMDGEGISDDFEKKTYTISQEIKDQLGDDLGMVEESLQQMFDGNFRTVIEFKGTEAIFTQYRGEDSQTDPATYVLTQGTHQMMEITTGAGEKRINQVAFKEGRLELIATEDDTILILKKTE